MATRKATYIDVESNPHRYENENLNRFILPSFITGKRYYLYMHTRIDTGDVFYIGVGTMDKGKFYRRAVCSQKRNNIWKRIMNKTKFNVTIVDESDIREDIMKKEIHYIKIAGKIKDGSGTLCNLTDGGEGARGLPLVWTEEMRRKASESAKKRITKEITRQKLRENIYKSNLIGRKGRESYVAKAIIKVDRYTGEFIEEFSTIVEAARAHNVRPQSISNALRNKRHSCNYLWEYKK